MKKRLFLLFSELGLHLLSHSFKYNSLVSENVLYKYNNILVLNLNKILYNFKKAVSFIKASALNVSNILFHVSSCFLLDYSIRLAFIFLVYITNNLSICDTYWHPGQGNRLLTLKKMLSLLYFKFTKFDGKRVNWLDLLMRLIFYTYFNRLMGVSWKLHFKKMVRYYKVFSYFKFFRMFFKFPDIFVLWNTLQFVHPLMEMCTLRIPSISTVSPYGSLEGITYPIVVNSASVLGAALMFKIFINAYRMAFTG